MSFTHDPNEYNNSTSQPPQNNSRTSQSFLGRFLRAACLVVVCAAFSAAAAFAVIEFRYQRGDFETVNQVVIGAAGSTQNHEVPIVPIVPVSAPGDEMPAYDIYDMALSQVVGIKTAPFEGADNDVAFHASSSAASGSGFVISTDGYILTNYHVIEFARFHGLPLSVTFHDGSSYPATIIGFDADNDVALIKTETEGLTPVLIGNSDDIRVGQRLYAIGNPFGDLTYTMTDGIVSALDRVLTVEGRSINFFQFTAAVNRGNSGGPIYNLSGEVIGIVTAKVIRGNAEGIGFAIPINDAISIATELIEYGYLAGRPFIGITGMTVSTSHPEFSDMADGMYIATVMPGSAAETAGLQPGDIIIAIGETATETLRELRTALRDYRAGDATTLTIWRDGEILTTEIVFDEDMYAGLPQRSEPPQQYDTDDEP